MNKKQLFAIIFVVCLLLAGIEIKFNGYFNTQSLKANLAEAEIQKDLLIQKIENSDLGLKIKKQNRTSKLFNVIDLKDLTGFNPATQTLFSKNKIDFFNLYTFNLKTEQNLTNYLTLKNLFEQIKNEEFKVNETNTFGKRSFYINNNNADSTNAGIARIIAFNRNYLIAIEYNKAYDNENNKIIQITLKKLLQEEETK